MAVQYTYKIHRDGTVVIPPPFRHHFGIDVGGDVTVEVQRGMPVMKPTKFKKIKREDLPPLPDWWQEALEDAKKSPLAQKSEAEIGQWTEELAERDAKRRKTQQTTD